MSSTNHNPRKGDLRTRFEASYIPEPNSGCWLWLGCVVPQVGGGNYKRGQISVDGRGRYASQISYELHVGEIPVGTIICHRCNNSLCVNPEHLYAGTHRQNSEDMVRAGRARLFTADTRPHNKFRNLSRNRLGKFA